METNQPRGIYFATTCLWVYGAGVVALLPIFACNTIHAQAPTLDWIAQFESSIAGFSLGPDNTVLVASHSIGPSVERDGPSFAEQHFVRRFSSDGGLLSTVDLNLPTDTWIDGIVTQSTGGLWVAGHEITQWGYDTPHATRAIPFVASYNAAGAIQFRSDSPEGQAFAAGGVRTMKADSLGNLNLLLVETHSFTPLSRSYALKQYDAAGNLLHEKTLDISSQFSRIDELSFDGAGDIVFAGATQVGAAGPPYDALVVKTDSLGDFVDADQFGDGDSNFARSVVVDSANNLWVGGSTTGSLAEPNVGFADAYIRKYDADGNLLFTRQFGTHLFNSVYAVAMDSSDNLWAVGGTVGSGLGSSDAFVHRYDPDGNLLYSRVFSTPEYEAFDRILIDSADNVFIAGASTTTLGGTTYGGVKGLVVKLSAAVPEPSAINVMGLVGALLMSWAPVSRPRR